VLAAGGRSLDFFWRKGLRRRRFKEGPRKGVGKGKVLFVPLGRVGGL
jgi:hypothetical protein